MLRLSPWGGPRRTQRLRPLPRDVSRETGPSSARAGSRGNVVRSGHREAAGAETGSRARGAAQAEAEVGPGPGPGQCRSLRYFVLRGTLPARLVLLRPTPGRAEKLLPRLARAGFWEAAAGSATTCRRGPCGSGSWSSRKLQNEEQRRTFLLFFTPDSLPIFSLQVQLMDRLLRKIDLDPSRPCLSQLGSSPTFRIT